MNELLQLHITPFLLQVAPQNWALQPLEAARRATTQQIRYMTRASQKRVAANQRTVANRGGRNA